MCDATNKTLPCGGGERSESFLGLRAKISASVLDSPFQCHDTSLLSNSPEDNALRATVRAAGRGAQVGDMVPLAAMTPVRCVYSFAHADLLTALSKYTTLTRGCQENFKSRSNKDLALRLPFSTAFDGCAVISDPMYVADTLCDSYSIFPGGEGIDIAFEVFETLCFVGDMSVVIKRHADLLSFPLSDSYEVYNMWEALSSKNTNTITI
jgi:hypothetical protein